MAYWIRDPLVHIRYSHPYLNFLIFRGRYCVRGKKYLFNVLAELLRSIGVARFALDLILVPLLISLPTPLDYISSLASIR